MKLSQNTDFTQFPRAVSVVPAASASGEISGRAVLAHDERHLRRRAIALEDGSRVLVDLLEAVTLADADLLVLEDGRQIVIASAAEDLFDVRARDGAHLAEIAWHIGSRHLAAQFAAHRILVLRENGMRAILEQLGATVTEVAEPFSPLQEAHHGHHHGHHHRHHHDHDHGHGGPDAFGRMPGDPHYGHNHP